MKQFSWKHPWSNAHETYFAERLQERYLYVYPGIKASTGADPQAESTVAIDASALAGRSTEGGPA